MGLNIENEETHPPLGGTTCQADGESMTAAVTEAVRARLERLRRAQGKSLADRLLVIGKDCGSHLNEPFKSIDHDELLYDEKGLPR